MSGRFAFGRLLSSGGNRPPPLVWIAGLAVGSVLILAPIYLLIRTAGAGPEAWDLMFRMRVLETLSRTVLLVVSVTAGCIALAVPLSWITVRTDLPGRGIWAVAIALPLVVPSYVAGFIVVVALGPKGMLQQFLEASFGLERLPEIYGFPGAWLTLTFLSYPYVLITVNGALSRMDPSLVESSRGLGQGSWGTFRRVVLPLLRPAITSGGLLVALYTLSDFGAVSLLRYETFTWAVFVQYESGLDRTLGAALSLALVAMALGILGLEFISRGRARYYRSDPGSPRPSRLVHLGRWRWPALGLCGLVLMISLVLPASVLVYWAARGISAGEPLVLLWGAARNSVMAGGLAAIAVVGAALPIAVLAVRYPSIFSNSLERITHIGFALPGIAVALALVFFSANYATPVYQSMALLVLAYVILFVSPAVGALRTTFLQISPRLEEAARSLGSHPWRVWGSITLPLARPGIASATALVFLLVMKELPATLILGPVGFGTLATQVWAAASEAFFAQAAVPALMLILLSSVPLGFLILRQRG